MRKLDNISIVSKLRNKEPLIVFIDDVNMGLFTYDEQTDSYVGFGNLKVSTITRVLKNNEGWLSFYE